MLTRDHGAALPKAQAVAAREHLHIRATMAPEARDELYRLKRLSGARFDREVARYMIDDHKKDIAEFKDQARTGDRATAALATATIPVLQKHLAVAESIRR
jgi:putative membrane protein